MRTFHSQVDLFDLLSPATEEGSAARDAGASASLAVPDRIQIPLLPKGEFQHEHYGDLSWTDEKFTRMQANFRAGATGTRPPLNADHASQNPFAASAPAYGWFEDLVITPHGLDAVVDLTRLGKEAIEQKLYRYISAEVAEEFTRCTGDSAEDVIAGGALTNYPFHDTMRGLFSSTPNVGGRGARQARCFSTSGPASFWAADQESTGGSMTLLDRIREKFKLPATATEADAVAALEAVPPPGAGAATTEEKPGAALAELVVGQPLDLSKHPAVLALTQQVEQLAKDRDALKAEVKTHADKAAAAEKELLEQGAAASVEVFVESGKIAPAQRETALRFALADPVLFKEHYEHAPAVLDFKARGFGGDGKPAGGDDDFNSQVLQLMQKEGLDYTGAALRISEDHPDLYERHRAQAFGGRGN